MNKQRRVLRKHVIGRAPPRRATRQLLYIYYHHRPGTSHCSIHTANTEFVRRPHMTDRTLDATLNGLKSGKIRERSDGVKQLRELLENDRVLERLHDSSEGQVWSFIHQAVFEAFGAEKAICTKKGALTTHAVGPGAQALKRLEELSSLTRFLIVRTATKLDKKNLLAVLEHLFQEIKYRGQLIDGVSLNYVKAIDVLLSHAPHMERVNEALWIRLVDLCFNIILGDPLTTRLENTDEEADTGVDSSNVSRSLGDVEGEDEDEQMEVDEAPRRLGKRPHAGTPRRARPVGSPGPAEPRATTPRPPGIHTVSQEQRAFLSLLRSLLTSPTAPILSKSIPILPTAILDRMARFLAAYSANTSLHSDFLQALARVLSILSLNKRTLVAKFARKTWVDLVSLWSMRNLSAREHLVVVLKILFPYYVIEESSPSATSSAHSDGVVRLWRALGPSDNKKVTEGLSLDALRLQLDPSYTSDQPQLAFSSGTFRHGWQFDEKQALAWAILELQADCAAKVLISHIHCGHSYRPYRSTAVRTLRINSH